MKNLLVVIQIAVLSCCLPGEGMTQEKEKGKDRKDKPAQGANQPKKDQDKRKPQDQVKSQGNNTTRDDDKNKGKSQSKDKFEDFNRGKSGNANHKADKDRGHEAVRKIVSSQGNSKHYIWDATSFKERNKIRKNDKVLVCHKFGRGDEPAASISISRNALDAHLKHGDVQGDCPVYKGKKTYSDVFLRKRNDYFSTYYYAQDEVVYSQSILDYAVQRLTGARTQLVTLQTTNAPVYVIEQRQAVVTELEENVSLLETALGVAATLIVAKLNN